MFSRYKYDVFISHAVEDKIPIANDICQRLEQAGLRVWYSGFDLRAGDSIHETIHDDLPKSRYAVVILSEHYLSKTWTMKEYYMLQAQEKAGRKVILPVLFDITADALRHDVYMADKFAIPFVKGPDHVIHKLLEVIQDKQPNRTTRRVKLPWQKISVAFAALLAILVIGYYLFSMGPTVPDEQLLHYTIEKRISDFQSKLNSEIMYETEAQKARPAQQQEVINIFTEFTGIKSSYRNEYEFSNDYKVSNHKKNVEADLNIDVERLKPVNAYGLERPTIFLSPRQLHGKVDHATYTFINTVPVKYTITHTQALENGNVEVAVTYAQNIRVVQANLIFPSQDLPKRYQLTIKGFRPIEKYIFQQSGETWTWTALE